MTEERQTPAGEGGAGAGVGSADWSDGWLSSARHVVSPNFDERPGGTVPDMVVIHYISLPDGQMETGYPVDLFCNRLNPAAHPDFSELARLRVSAHFFIDRSGQITQLVSVRHRAWHAGVSAWQGRVACNDFSVGIELEGDSRQPFDDRQYDSLERLSLALAAQWPIAHWVGHSDIAPGRKSDPGPFFDWARLLKKVADTDPRIQK